MKNQPIDKTEQLHVQVLLHQIVAKVLQQIDAHLLLLLITLDQVVRVVVVALNQVAQHVLQELIVELIIVEALQVRVVHQAARLLVAVLHQHQEVVPHLREVALHRVVILQEVAHAHRVAAIHQAAHHVAAVEVAVHHVVVVADDNMI